MSRRASTTVLVAALSALLCAPAGASSTPPRAVAPAHLAQHDPAPDTPAPVTLAEPVAAASADTFALHSDPGAPYTIYLDFVGTKLVGTLWNTVASILTPILTIPSWDPSGDGSQFGSDELARIQEIWQRVSADYAPFDVDVTTQDPGTDALVKSSSKDTQYGVRVLFLGTDSASDTAYASVCDSTCGGIAFQPSFGSTDLTPALIFTDALGPDDPKFIADAASHEAGHTLGLSHDGVYPDDASNHVEYYDGRSGWGPLMGSPYSMPMSQWSRGSYANASNTEDDVAIIAKTLGFRPDEAGSTVATAEPLDDGTGFITSQSDVDTFDLGQCSGTVQLSAAPAVAGTDLDVDLRLLDADGQVLSEANPAMRVKSYTTATGLDATLTTSVPSGVYYVQVRGAGAASNSPYDSYGSLGSYAIATSGGCAPSLTDAAAPDAPGSVTATASRTAASITVAWTPPASSGDSPVTGYRVTLGNATVDLSASARSHTFTGLSLDTAYVASVAARNATGLGAPTGAAAHTIAKRVGPAGAVTRLAAHWRNAGRFLRVTWRRPAYNGGAAVTAYRISIDGHYLGSVAVPRHATTVRNLRPGRHRIGVRAVNAAGRSRNAVRKVRVPRRR